MKQRHFLHNALSEEGESSLEYLLGTHPGRYDDIVSKPFLKGYALRTLYRLIKTLRHVRVAQEAPPAEVIVYAGTNNQLTTLLPLALVAPDNWHFYLRKGLKAEGIASRFTVFCSISDYLLGTLTCLTRGVRLYMCSGASMRHSMKIGADRFFQCYFEILTFYRLLSSAAPSLVVVSNDHNPDNRSLLLVARLLGIKTAYLQHASVNERFPPLSVDYAFLDGEAALRSYEKARMLKNERPKQVKIFLSGQKKTLQVSQTLQKSRHITVGLSLNRLDNLRIIESFIKKYLVSKCTIVIRPHPSDSRRSDIRDMVSAYPEAEYSDSREESVNLFLSRLDIQLAGNSSIHLEATLAGKISYCCDFGGNYKGDHYGFLEAGLVTMFPTERLENGSETLSDLVTPIGQRAVLAARYYSSTYMTRWQGNEGVLVNKILKKLLADDNLEDELLVRVPLSTDYEVYDIRHNND